MFGKKFSDLASDVDASFRGEGAIQNRVPTVLKAIDNTFRGEGAIQNRVRSVLVRKEDVKIFRNPYPQAPFVVDEWPENFVDIVDSEDPKVDAQVSSDKVCGGEAVYLPSSPYLHVNN